MSSSTAASAGLAMERRSIDYIDQRDVGQFLIRDAQRAIGADVARAHNRNFLSQCKLLWG